jgi:diguanylate cyclase (GGDEF)-like protein
VTGTVSIRTWILASCLALTLLTGAMGLFLERADQALADVALDIYDNAFMAVSYLRSAELGFAQLAARAGGAPAPAMDSILGDLDVALARAMSPQGRAQVAALRAELVAAASRLAGNPSAAAAVQADFERAVETFADDGFRYRKRVADHVARQLRQTGPAVLFSLLAVLAITLLVGHCIAAPVRRAARIAQAVAGGRLDNRIAVRGRGETADLLRALAAMQDNITALMAAQAASHADELAAHHAQMSAALDNMSQGLCLFDAEDRLLVANRRFASMFGRPRAGATRAEVLTAVGLDGMVEAMRDDLNLLPVELADGRVIAVAEARIASGGRVATYEDVTDRRAAERQLAHLARHDMLTGLGNRLQFNEVVAASLARAPPGRPAAMLCINLDHFRIVNNTLGPAVGDALLAAAAQRLRANLRGEHDTVFRLGGDEFAIFQEDARDARQAAALAGRLIERFAEPFRLGEHWLDSGISIGIACTEDAAAPQAEALLRCAALALRQAKADGRGCYRLFRPEMDAQLQARRQLELDLREALGRGEMMVFYQPQVSAERRLCGFEALLRWRHPQRGMVSPGVFIPVAEEIGLIGALGDWVLHRACLAAARWPDGVKVSVNLSPLQLQGRALADDVAAALAESRLAPARLELEITEAVMLQSDAGVLQTLSELRALGVRIAMDDFGTGYSSLGYLSRFPFDKIKIDQSFVRAMTERVDCLAIIRAVIGLGRALGMGVIAEGVETDEQCELLIAEGCSELQGYLFGRPLPEEAVAGMLVEDARADAPAVVFAGRAQAAS